MKNIDNIIFDLGNVILNIDYQNTINAFEKIGVEDASSFYSKSSQLNIFNQLETGHISKQNFILEIQKFVPKASATQIINAWNAILQDLPNERIEILKNIKDKFSIFLLSNTNTIHIEKIIDKLGKKKYAEFYNLFDKVYYSHEVKLRKPNADIFKLVIKENCLSIKNTLFIDDSIQHIESAKKIGLKTYHLDGNETLESIFPDIIQ
ncbi:MAG: HAD family phosphatase [Flavobacteriales bacterium]|nr:HAD family phosphatase [Flavobacteriales bacterium]